MTLLSAQRKNSSLALLAFMTLLVAGCSDLSRTEQRVLSGGAIGASAGAAGAVLTGGCVSCGAAIGGAVGAGTGYLMNKVR